MKHMKSLVSAVLLSGMLVGCTKPAPAMNEVEKPTEAPAEKTTETKVEETVSLADWMGTWNSIEGYYEEAEVKEALMKVAEAEKVDVAELTAEKLKECHVEWLGLKIDENKITFLDNFAAKNGNEIETVEYEFVEMKTVAGEEEEHSHWAVFKAKGEAKHPVLIMMPVHGEDEITHFHIRYGENVEELLDRNDWWPVMAKDSSTMDQVITEVTH